MLFLSRFTRLLAWLIVPASLLFLAACSSSEDRAQSYYKSGLQYADKGDLVKASLEFRNALKLDGNFIDAMFELGKVEERKQNFAGAVKLYVSVAEHAADHIESRLRLSFILLAAGQIDLAKKYADEAYAIDKTNPGALVAEAAIKLKLNNRAEAIQFAKEALKAKPDSVNALMVLASERLTDSDAKGALEYLDKAPATSNTNIGLQMLRLATLDAMGDQPGVEKLFDKLISLFPDNKMFPQALANWYLSKDRIDDAERVMRQLGAANPDDIQTQLSVVAFLNSKRGSDAAIAELNRLIETNKSAGHDVFSYQIALAQIEYNSGDRGGAIALAQTLVSDTADAKEQNQARIALARMLVNDKEPDKAKALTDEVVASDPGNADALSVRASIRLLQNDPAGATKDLLAALNESPDNAVLHGLLAEAYERAGSVTLAEQEYGKALTLDNFSANTALPYVQFLIRYGKSDQALRTLENVRARTPADRRILSLLAQLKLEARDWTGAQEVAEELRKLDTGEKDTTADQIKAAALSGLNKYSESIELLKSSLSDSANLQSVLPSLISVYVRAGRPQVAEEFLKSIIDGDPSNIQAQVLLGSVYASMGSDDLAAATLKKAATASNSVVGDVALAQFYLSKANLKASEAAADAGLKKDPQSTSLKFLLAAVYERNVQFDKAIAIYEDLFKQNPESTVFANDLASLLSERRGDKQSLDRSFEIAQRFANSKVPQYLDTLGWIYYLRDDYASALPLIRTAAGDLPEIAAVQYHYGMTLMQLGQNDAAKKNIEKALSLTPALIEADAETAKQALKEIAAGGATASGQSN